jgi:hypothetical protein
MQSSFLTVTLVKSVALENHTGLIGQNNAPVLRTDEDIFGGGYYHQDMMKKTPLV